MILPDRIKALLKSERSVNKRSMNHSNTYLEATQYILGGHTFVNNHNLESSCLLATQIPVPEDSLIGFLYHLISVFVNFFKKKYFQDMYFNEFW